MVQTSLWTGKDYNHSEFKVVLQIPVCLLGEEVPMDAH